MVAAEGELQRWLQIALPVSQIQIAHFHDKISGMNCECMNTSPRYMQFCDAMSKVGTISALMIEPCYFNIMLILKM